MSIDKVILRRDGSELNVPKTQCSQAVSEEVALAMVQALKPVITGGTGARANPGGPVPLAGKTGTTDNRIHTWMIGFSSEVATATWVGNVSARLGRVASESTETKSPSFDTKSGDKLCAL